MRSAIITRRQVLSLAPAAPAIAQKAVRPPNILLLFADQHQAGALSCAGGPMRTPNLDRLAAGGVRFERAYCQDGICVPSRTSLMTGQYPRTTGVIDNADSPPLVSELLPLQRYLREQGYLTACIGKRHLKKGTQKDFDYSCTTISPKQDPSDENYDDWLRKRGKEAAWERDRSGAMGVPMGCLVSELADDETAEAYTAQKTIEFLARAAKSGKPFFCWSSFQRPHQPYTPTKRWASMYDPARVVLPASLRQPVTDLPPMMARWRRNRNTPWSLALAAENESFYRTYMAYYYGLVSEVDECAGRILAALDREKLGDTIILYASDHGDFVAGHGMIEKCALGHNVYEETLRVPLIVNYPKLARGGVVRSDLVELVDLYPTILDLAGLPRPAGYHLPGISLVPTLRGGTPLGRKYAISENWSQVTAIGERYKFGQWLEPPNAQYDYRKFGDVLFDRINDPAETRNLAGTEAAGATEQELRRYIKEWSAQTPDRAKKLAAPNALKTRQQAKKK